MRKLPSGNWNTVVKINGKCVSVTAPTKAECEYQASLLKTQRRKRNELTVRQCVEKYIAISESLSPTTLHSYERILENSFEDFMELDVDSLDNITVQNAINIESKRISERTGKPLSAKTVKNEWGLLSSALRTVAGKSFLIKLPKVQHKNVVLPDPGKVLKAIKGSNVELPCLLAMWCGMRLSEIRGLTYGAIHNDYISIDQVMVDVGNKSVLKTLAKTDTSIRKVPMPNYIKGLIKPQDKAKNDLVVSSTRNSIYHHFTRLMAKEGIDISIHDLRHLYASIMLTKLGVADKIVQKTGGWATDTVLKTVYSNVFTDSEIEAAKVRDAYFESLF